MVTVDVVRKMSFEKYLHKLLKELQWIPKLFYYLYECCHGFYVS